MAEELYAASAGICAGNWGASPPRNAMFPGVGLSSPCFVNVSNFYLPVESPMSGRIHDDHIGSNSLEFSSWDYEFLATSLGNGFTPSAFSDRNQALFAYGEKVAEISSYTSILSEFSREVSSSFVSDLYDGAGKTAGNLNNQTKPVSEEDHISNLNQLSAPSRPSNKTATTDSINVQASSVDLATQQRPRSKSPRDVKSSTKRKTNILESMLKRPRIENPSPSPSPLLPTFKVRKEKLGDRIIALQQLVSPFGKTDTGSVLHEAIDYIKFLHNQVHMLSDIHGGFPRLELRSRGLCLVPISSTFPVDFVSPDNIMRN